MAGLEPKEGDVILAIGGSGDQAFAMLEHGARVIAVDHAPSQIAFIDYRRDVLACGDYAAFVKRVADFLYLRDVYFNDLARLARIRDNLANLQILPPGDIFDVLRDSCFSFSKLYLSNLLLSGAMGLHQRDRELSFGIGSRLLPLRGRVYFTNGDIVEDFIPSTLVLNQQLTECSQRLEQGNQAQRWFPAVYEKVA